jgi:hypothetical protein
MGPPFECFLAKEESSSIIQTIALEAVQPDHMAVHVNAGVLLEFSFCPSQPQPATTDHN